MCIDCENHTVCFEDESELPSLAVIILYLERYLDLRKKLFTVGNIFEEVMIKF